MIFRLLSWPRLGDELEAAVAPLSCYPPHATELIREEVVIVRERKRAARCQGSQLKQ